MHKRLALKKIKVISNRVTYHINNLTTLKIIRVYAPTCDHENDEVGMFYEDISEVLAENRTDHSLVIGYFNCKIGKQTNKDEKGVGQHGLGIRNQRGKMMTDFLEQEMLYNTNTFYKKQNTRKWARISPDGWTKNQTDYILSNKKYIIQDVDVVNTFNTGRDHRHKEPKLPDQLNNKQIERSAQKNGKSMKNLAERL